MTLRDLEIGGSAIISAVGGEGALRQHFLDMGVIPGAEVTLVKYAPMGDPMELRVQGYALTLRVADAEKILIEKITKEELEKRKQDLRERQAHYVAKMEHPGLGEEGKYHVKADENPLPEGTMLTFALAGNQNCGKTVRMTPWSPVG